jgi:tetratricopeptide (TPR) repeat protein/tRNA A-37 threonylcarbamoyl transferase component Bud32
MSSSGDPTRTAAVPADPPPADTRTDDGGLSDGSPTCSFRAPTGPYSDFTPHARGGIGEVFRATDAALNRTVAVKRLQDRRANDPEACRRFLVEAEVTARLEHPGVVPVYALFTDDGGGPAYAMRFVQGPTLWDALAEYHAGPSDPVAFRRLLQSFLQVCQTVAYAHTRGVIHRDLKPQNILLGKFGETLVVDWGLAKVVGRPEENRAEAHAESTLVPGSDGSGHVTAMGSAVGTPAYMSPEQAAGRWDVVTQPSDVYGLGAVLYTVLTGRPPLDKGNWPEMQQRIQRGDFPRPRQLKPDVPRGLEAVCLKAMAHDPLTRYPSAEALAADIEHWMADEPVAARRDGLGTRTRRWAKRNRPLVTAAAVLLVAALVGLSAGAVLLGRKNREVEHQRQAAETAQGKAEAINQFLIDDLLKQADPVNNPLGDKLTVRNLLDKAADRLNHQTSLAGQPEVEAELRAVVGHAYEYLEAYDRAEPQYRRAWQLQSARLGPEHPATLVVRNRLIRAVVDLELPGAEAAALDAVAVCDRALGPGHRETAEATNNLAELYHNQRRYDESVPLRRRACAAGLASGGPYDDKTLEYDNNLAATLVTAGSPAEAMEILESVADRRRQQNPDHPELATTLQNLGAAYIHVGRFPDAEAVLRRAVDLQTRLRGPTNPGTLAARNLLAHAVEGRERWAEAEKMYLVVLADRREFEPAHQPAGVERTLVNLVRLYAKQQRWADAAQHLSALILSLHPDPNRRAEALTAALAAAFVGTADPANAGPLLKEALNAVEGRTWKGDWFRGELASRYGDDLRRQGDFDTAKPILESAADDVSMAVGVPAWGLAAARKRVADMYKAWKKPDEAAKWK